MSPEPEKMVYFIRHGESEGNISPKYQGPDSPLSPRGREQAARIAERMAKLPFDALIASPFARTRETAAFISAATQKPVEYSELFVERVKPSSIIGRSDENPETAGVAASWEQSLYTPGMTVEDGENFDALLARAGRALDFLRDRPEQNLMVVTHGYFLRTLIARVLLGERPSPESYRLLQSRMETQNAGLTVFQHKGRWDGPAWTLWVFNDHAHLD